MQKKKRLYAVMLSYYAVDSWVLILNQYFESLLEAGRHYRNMKRQYPYYKVHLTTIVVSPREVD